MAANRTIFNALGHGVHEKWFGNKQGVRNDRGAAGNSYKEIVATETTGWRPTCSHEGEPVPCTVLDIFLGSGTVGKVAQDLGREWIGIELNENYCELARKRTANHQEVMRLA